MVKKTKLWRKTLSDKLSTKAAAEALKQRSGTSELFTSDTVGTQNKPVEAYPEKFARPIFPASLTRAEHFKIKEIPVKRPRAENSEVFDLWEEENDKEVEKHSHIPAVIRPHPGMSYRPAKADHEEVLEKVVDEEIIKEIDRIKHEEVVNGYTVVENDPSPVQSEDEGPVEFRKNKPIVRKNLTTTEKNIKKRNKLKEKLKKMIAEEKKTQKKLEKIPAIISEIERLDEKYKRLREEKEVTKKMKIELEKTGEIVPKIRMGKFRYKKPDTLASLTPTSTLRSLSVKGNPCDDRFDSFIRRKMVDLSTPKPAKVIKLKDCSQNEYEIAYTESQKLKKKQQKSGNIPLAK